MDAIPGPHRSAGGLLPVGRERSDAAANRARILASAAVLSDQRGLANLRMDEVAEHAGVGVGTIYRRFGDRSGLILALVDHSEVEFQQAFLFGPPPLGPGADPLARIRAFVRAFVDRVVLRGEALLVAETSAPFGRFSRAYGLHHTHLASQIAAADPEADAAWLADAVLAAMSAELVQYQLDERRWTAERIVDGVLTLVAASVRTTS
ncbi:TetR/AcrR family transcriptional regulator [Janibacter alkaliphilus]|uniref:AcrR family transcriptional regulator n=1 Tax=Janibacter alkaliphilus TaxID=1069963 RepID=A0A852X061_9MICO|nr:TetR/AcrR family transcriptional regulator [Janibacter alkaliphilus]NYG36506.1 AcrR family transcriptional regulator [Janibacter alkaliphilus]